MSIGGRVVRRFGAAPAAWLGTQAIGVAGAALPEAWTRLDRPIFILGCARAGTTLFAEIFGRHPDLASWMEAAPLWDLPLDGAEADDYRDERWATAWEARRLRTVFALFLRLHGKPRLVNKNNRNALRLRLLDKVFPGCLVLHVMRDPRPVVVSAMTRARADRDRRKAPFGRFPKPIAWRDYLDQPLVDQFAHQWADITDYVRSQGESLLGPERYAEVRFEDFRAHPEYELTRLDAFCGLDNERRDLSALGLIGRAYSDDWQGLLSAQEIDRIHAIVGPQMHRLGYPWD